VNRPKTKKKYIFRGKSLKKRKKEVKFNFSMKDFKTEHNLKTQSSDTNTLKNYQIRIDLRTLDNEEIEPTKIPKLNKKENNLTQKK